MQMSLLTEFDTSGKIPIPEICVCRNALHEGLIYKKIYWNILFITSNSNGKFLLLHRNIPMITF
jgi:hypothetical protein